MELMLLTFKDDMNVSEPKMMNARPAPLFHAGDPTTKSAKTLSVSFRHRSEKESNDRINCTVESIRIDVKPASDCCSKVFSFLALQNKAVAAIEGDVVGEGTVRGSEKDKNLCIGPLGVGEIVGAVTVQVANL